MKLIKENDILTTSQKSSFGIGAYPDSALHIFFENKKTCLLFSLVTSVFQNTCLLGGETTRFTWPIIYPHYMIFVYLADIVGDVYQTYIHTPKLLKFH